MAEPQVPAERQLIAYELYPNVDVPLEPAPIPRDWMDRAYQRFPYRCLPLTIANQCGWILRSSVGFRVYWYGGPGAKDMEVQFDDVEDKKIASHFGLGVLTFNVPYLFRTPPGINLLVKGPTNWIKDGIQPLEGVVETDWLASTFTMNWKVTRVCEWVRFDKGEPFCMLIPIPRGLAETLVPVREPIANDPEVQAQYRQWDEGRREFHTKVREGDPEAIKRGWQKEYFQGKMPDGSGAPVHQTRLNLKEFKPGEYKSTGDAPPG